MNRLAALLIALPTLAPAQDLTAEESSVLPRIIDHACLDLIDDVNGCENVTLLWDGIDAADLIITRDARDDPTAPPLLVARNFVWAGGMWGQWPVIGQRDNGSLVIRSENFGVGRGAWTTDMTLAWRDGQFVVLGYTQTDIDRLTAFSATCDVNLMTGAFETSISTYREASAKGQTEEFGMAAADWTLDQSSPDVCLENVDLIYQDGEACASDQPPKGCPEAEN